jgi:hypothetical protein
VLSTACVTYFSAVESEDVEDEKGILEKKYLLEFPVLFFVTCDSVVCLREFIKLTTNFAVTNDTNVTAPNVRGKATKTKAILVFEYSSSPHQLPTVGVSSLFSLISNILHDPLGITASAVSRCCLLQKLFIFAAIQIFLYVYAFKLTGTIPMLL